MKKYTLSNGLKVIEHSTSSLSVTIQITVKVGSNDEHDEIRGISHFIEHMMFEGTSNRADAKTISNEIESLGGDINAFTDNTRTSYYIKVPKKHFEKALDILSDMIKNSLFLEKNIEKERDVILKEINIYNDESRYYQWILFTSSLFSKHPSKYPPYGTIKDVKNISRKDILSYFNRHYNANNSILTIVGGAKATKKLVEKYFSDYTKGKPTKTKTVKEPQLTRPIIKKVKRQLMNSYCVLGYKTVPRTHPDSFALDVLQAIFGKGQSGKLFDEIRNKRGLAYEVGVYHKPSTDYGYFAVYFGAEKKNIPLAKQIIFDEINKLPELTEKEIKEAKGFIDGKYILNSEDTEYKADKLSFWEQIKDADFEKEYLKKIKKVTKKDILRVAKKYLGKNYCMSVIEQK